MQDEYTDNPAFSGGDDEALYDAIERDARRYDKAFSEAEEASCA